MFIVLLLVIFFVSVLVCFGLARVFRKPVQNILQRLIPEDLYAAWTKYLIFALYVVGLSSGGRVWDLQKYITPRGDNGAVLELTQDRWILEVYSSIIGTLQGVAWMLLVFFLFALVSYVIVKGQELRRQPKV